MTTDQLVEAWREWLADNPNDTVGVLLDRLARIAVEARRPSAQRDLPPEHLSQRRKLFKRWR